MGVTAMYLSCLLLVGALDARFGFVQECYSNVFLTRLELQLFQIYTDLTLFLHQDLKLVIHESRPQSHLYQSLSSQRSAFA